MVRQWKRLESFWWGQKLNGLFTFLMSHIQSFRVALQEKYYEVKNKRNVNAPRMINDAFKAALADPLHEKVARCCYGRK